jgi:hypothetical protein
VYDVKLVDISLTKGGNICSEKLMHLKNNGRSNIIRSLYAGRNELKNGYQP